MKQYFTLISEENLESLLKIKEDLIQIKERLNPSETDELLTREETCQYLKISLPTCWKWTKKGKLKAYSIANKLYYKKSEIINSLKLLK